LRGQRFHPERKCGDRSKSKREHPPVDRTHGNSSLCRFYPEIEDYIALRWR
jgi:hypothetical protein